MVECIKPICFDQGAKPWRDNIYSNHGNTHQTMRSSGSAPTLCANIVASLKDNSVDPWQMARLSLEWGCRTYSSGTTWNYFAKVARHFKFRKYVESSKFESLIECLNAGGYIICSMRPGYWCKAGSYICAWKYDEKYVYCITGNGREDKQKISDFKNECKMYFCFYPDHYLRPGLDDRVPDEIKMRFQKQKEKLENAMTVKQLIDYLHRFPKDLPVVVDGDFIEQIKIVNDHNLGDPCFPGCGCETCRALYIE